ncbi:MAG: aminoacyl--tRNA ligase-related protein [Patescibacteria group bacterium]
MRYSSFFPQTIKEAPKDEVAVNAKYLIRGGYIDKLMAGSYTLLPLGMRVVQKINQIIREEMNKTGAQELLMPLLHPKEIWNETGRWDSAKEVMYQFEKNDKEYALSFTHEEIVMDLIRKHTNSYKNLPVKVYHFSTKFRNELRAKSGILRGREFMMKDLYSAHRSEEDLLTYYWQVADAYIEIFKRIGIDVKITEADGGVFTKSHTHEFQALCEVGEDTIYHKEGWKFWKNKEVMTQEELDDPEVKNAQAIEVGNIFPLGTMYAERMNALFTDEDGSRKPVWFASYGIGPTRVMGTVVEISHDDRGIIWPEAIAPFAVHLIGLHERADEVYEELVQAGVDVLYDDRWDSGAGEKFADADLIGIPVRLVVSSKTHSASSGQAGEQVEWKKRDSSETELLATDEVIKRLT